MSAPTWAELEPAVGPLDGWRSVPRRPEPWQAVDAAVLSALLGCSAVALLVCWLGARGEPSEQASLVWLAVGIGGLVPGFVGCAGWLLRGLRAVRRTQQLLLVAQPVPLQLASAVLAEVALPVSDGVALPVPDEVALPGSALRHRPSCLLVQGKPFGAASAAATACGVCRP